MNARGIDVSKWQDPGAINWAAVASECAFVFARATYGTTLDKRFVAHVTAASAAGMRVGGYHFFRQTQPVEQQIQAFFMALDDAGCGPGWLPPVIDVESNRLWDGDLDPVLYRVGVRAMIDACRERFGGCIVYINPSDSALLGDPDWFRDPDVLLWIAHHTDGIPTTPNSTPWTFWQTTGSGNVVGYDGEIDLNVFAGPAERLPVIGADTEPATAPDTERPPPMTIEESHSIQISQIGDLAKDLTNGLLAMNQKLDQLVAMVSSTNATLTYDHERIDRLEERVYKSNGGNGASPTPAE